MHSPHRCPLHEASTYARINITLKIVHYYMQLSPIELLSNFADGPVEWFTQKHAVAVFRGEDRRGLVVSDQVVHGVEGTLAYYELVVFRFYPEVFDAVWSFH